MTYIVWEFTVETGNRAAFEKAYKSDGVWAKLFRKDGAYKEAILIADAEQAGRYLTIDVWEDKDSYARFKDRFATEYHEIDKQCEALTAGERRLGIFERIP